MVRPLNSLRKIIRSLMIIATGLLACLLVPAAQSQETSPRFSDIRAQVEAGNVTVAEVMLREAISQEPAESRDRADLHFLLAWTLSQKGDIDGVIEQLSRQVSTLESVDGLDADTTTSAANNLTAALISRADQRENEGNYAAAEADLQRIVFYYSRYAGSANAEALGYMRRLAINIKDQNRPADAEVVMNNAINLMEEALEPSDPELLAGYNDLGRILEAQERHAEAEALYRQAYDLGVASDGKDDKHVLIFAQNIGASLMYQHRFIDAEPIVRDTLERRTRTLGIEHPERLYSLSDLALLQTMTEDYDGAHQSYEELLPLYENVFGPDHPTVAQVRNSYSILLAKAPGNEAAFLGESRQVAQMIRARRIAIGLGGSGQREQSNFSEKDSFYFETLLHALRNAGEAPGADRELLFMEAIEVIQEAMDGPTSLAVLRRAAERAAGSQGAELGAAVSRRQELAEMWSQLATQRDAMVGDDSSEGLKTAAMVAAQQAEIDKEMAAIDAKLRADFPAYFDLVRPHPLDGIDAQNLFNIQADGPWVKPSNEAALLIQPTPFGTHVIAISSGNIDWAVSKYTTADMNRILRRLRWDVGAQVNPTNEESKEWAAEGSGAYPFDRRLAFALYRELIEPVEWVLENKRHVYVVGGKGFASLPFGVLVTEEPTGEDGNPDDLRNTAWLADKYALIQLPSLQSLQFLRQYGNQNSAELPDSFVGFGDPALEGAAATRSGGTVTRSGNSNAPQMAIEDAFANTMRDSSAPTADVTALRSLSRLPGTLRELQEMRNLLGAPASSIVTGSNATESAVKSANLADASIIAFATHGLLGGEIDGSSEPGLVFTPPDAPTLSDDGLLTMSEIANLSMNAEWVILSACNTAAGDGASGAPGLSGLVKAFFLAGADSLLATHWPVRDDVAAKLTVRTIAIKRDNPELSKAEALQRAMREIRMDTSADSANDTWAHPNAWAPFTLIGDGLGG